MTATPTESVFQCEACRSILGDSTAWDSTHKTLRAISLRRTSRMVVMGKDLITSTHPKDLGSSYYELHCGMCDVVVGRLYKTTTPSLDSVRERFAFFVDKVSRYELGSGPKAKEPDDFMTSVSLSQLQVQIQKIQMILVSFNERLEKAEKALSTEEEEEEIKSEVPLSTK